MNYKQYYIIAKPQVSFNGYVHTPAIIHSYDGLCAGPYFIFALKEQPQGFCKDLAERYFNPRIHEKVIDEDDLKRMMIAEALKG